MKQPDYRAEARANRAVQLGWGVLLLVLLLFAGPTIAAVAAVDGELVTADSDVMVEPIAPLSAAELEELVGPVALYPDDLLSIVLAASTHPLQVVQASRFLERRQQNADLQPDEQWDDSVVALLNYPEALALLNDDLDWTWKLGEAVLVQQEDVLTAVADFRERARVAGNLESDERQVVEVLDDGAIEIKAADPEVIYVPYYEPSRVTVYHDYPVYHYYPHAYPVYYYPYPAGYRFSAGYFWGVTSAFSIGWSSHRLHLHHHAFRGHPYYGRTYYDRYYYRRPHLSLTYNYYRDYARHWHSAHRHHAGNYWRPRSIYYGASPRHAYRHWAHRDGHRHHRRLHHERRKHRQHHPDRDHQRGHRARRPEGSDGRGDGQRHTLVADSGRRGNGEAGGQRPAAGQAPQPAAIRTTPAPEPGPAAALTRVQRESLRALTQGNIPAVTPQRSVAGRRGDVAPRRNGESRESRIANHRGWAPRATQAARPTPAKIRRAAAPKVQRTAPPKLQATARRQAQAYAQRSAPIRAQRAQSQRRAAPKAQHRGTSIRQSAGHRSGKRISFARN